MKALLQFPARLLAAFLLLFLGIYRYAISPVIHMLAPGCGCRFTPTCSEYAVEAIRKHGPARGTWLAVRRLLKCHPWGDWGHDPVPQSCTCPKHPHTRPSSSVSSPESDGSTNPAAQG